MRTWRFERVRDSFEGFDIYCDDIYVAYSGTEPAFEAEDLALVQFIVDACNALEQEPPGRNTMHGLPAAEEHHG